MVAKRRGKKEREDNQPEPETDYGATADAFADRDSDEGAKNVDELSDDSESGSDDQGEEQEGSESESEAEDEAEPMVFTPHSATGEQCTFDLRNLLAMNSHQLDTSTLYSKKTKKTPKEENIAIPPEQLDIVVNEKYLLEKATDGCTQLIASLWNLPNERSDAGPMVTLPSFDASSIPRMLPPPPPKKETKWEKFAREKGLPLNKNKRSRKVWDEGTGEWAFRHGYQKANSESKEWPIMEVGATQDPFDDPWEKQREEKLERKNKNVESRMRNEERAGNMSKGTTTRMLKSKDRTRKAGQAGGNLDRDRPLPTGVPVDLRPTKSDGDLKASKRGKISTMAALVATQRSTASLGKFDKMLEGEPERKKITVGAKKRKQLSNTDKKVVSTETERSMKLFKTAIGGGGVEKEKARRKGKLAKGETAYDYDFDDGLGPSTFRKKKGRAGAGKTKKMTKKRIK